MNAHQVWRKRHCHRLYTMQTVGVGRVAFVDRRMVLRVPTSVAVVLLFGFPGAALGQTTSGGAVAGEPAVTSFITQDFHVTTWEGTRGSNVFAPERGKGSQLYAPLTMGQVVDYAGSARFEVAAKSAYIWSHHDTPGQEATYSGLTDSQVSASMTVHGFSYVSPLVGILVNLPTGQSFLPGAQRFARMDVDLVEIGAYGEGLNLNPFVGFTFAPSRQFTLTPSVGYAWRGKFDREGFDAPTGFYNLRQSIDPGDVLTASLNAAGKIGASTFQGSVAFTSESDLTKDGVPFARLGRGYIANMAILYPVMERFNLLGNVSWKFNEKNKIAGDGGLVDEAKNSNSHLIIGSIQPMYDLADGLRVGLNYSILYRSENFYDIVEEAFIPAKLKHSLGLTLDYGITQNTTLSLTASHFWVEQHPGSLLLTRTATTFAGTSSTFENLPPELNYTGWLATAAAKVRF